MPNGDFQCDQKDDTLTCKFVQPSRRGIEQPSVSRISFAVFATIMTVLFFSALFSLAATFFPDALTMLLITGGILFVLVRFGQIPLSRILGRFGV